MAGKIEQPADLSDLESLTQSRKQIDRKYDFRYSVLTDVWLSSGRRTRRQIRRATGCAGLCNPFQVSCV